MKVSIRAKPIIVRLNSVSSKSGDLLTLPIKEENINPVATSHPNNGNAANPNETIFIDLTKTVHFNNKNLKNS